MLNSSVEFLGIFLFASSKDFSRSIYFYFCLKKSVNLSFGLDYRLTLGESCWDLIASFFDFCGPNCLDFGRNG